MAITDDPLFANVSASAINPSNSEESEFNGEPTASFDPNALGEDDDFSIKSSLV